MSLIDEVKSVQERVLARLRELEPLVQEHRELSHLAERLDLDFAAGSDRAAPAATDAKPAAARSRTGKSVTRAKGARRAATPGRARTARRSGATREEQVLAAVQATPGITVAQVAKQIGVDPTSLYRVVRKLTKEGTLIKRGLELHPRT
jgi:DNA-binding NtrC family response regulator